MHLKLDPAGIYLLKVSNRNTRTKVWNMFKVNNKHQNDANCSSVSIVNFEYIIAGWGKLVFQFSSTIFFNR